MGTYPDRSAAALVDFFFLDQIWTYGKIGLGMRRESEKRLL